MKKIIRKTLIFATILLLLSTSMIANPVINKKNVIEQEYDEVQTKDEYTPIDLEYIRSITQGLSDIVFSEYNESNNEIARGRAFGTKGEHKAAEILNENMTNLGLWVWNETIVNLPELPKVASAFWVNDYKIIVTNLTSEISKEVEGYIAPAWRGPREDEENYNYTFEFENLEIKEEPKITIPIGRNIRKITNKNNYAFITEDRSFNPYDKEFFIKKLLLKFLSPYSDFTIFFGGLKRILKLTMWYNFYPKCQALIRYNFDNDTYNMGNSVEWALPTIFINGSVGKEIMDNLKNYQISFKLDQTYKEQVESYNVIGQLNGTDREKIVLIDCLYDGWWCQGTADSAIGMAMVMGIAKWFKDNDITPKYTIKFIGFGGEEHGYRGAQYYEAAHKHENIIYVFDLNQLGFSQEYPELYLDFLGSNKKFLDDLFEIAQQSNYAERTGYAGIRKFYMPRGAPSDDQPFARNNINRPNCKTICFLKGFDWIMHHRDGINHTKGDTMDFYDENDVEVTIEIILNIIKEYII